MKKLIVLFVLAVTFFQICGSPLALCDSGSIDSTRTSEIVHTTPSETSDSQSEISNPESEISNPQSTIPNPQSVDGASVEYRQFPIVGSRLAVWFVGQLHLMFAAFILGVPMFAVIVEFIGICTKKPRFDRMAKELIKLTMAAFSTTAILGALLIFIFVGFYPKFFNYFASIFHDALWVYALIFFGETFMLYLYRYSWDKLKDKKIRHLTYGIILNLFGIAIMMLTNSWVSFTISPSGIDDNGNLVSLMQAITNFTWMPLNIHRFIANICFGGAVVAAFASFKFLTAKTNAEKAYYDWEGYIGNFIAISAFLVLPFAGYLLTKEIYAYNQQLGISLMGGFLSWLWIIQAVLIGVLFMGTNYYLWVGMERIPGSERYKGYTKYLVCILTLSFMVWATPHTLVASIVETMRMGGTHHPVVGFLGVMSAKNTAVNLMILTTYVSFFLYRRSNKIATVSWARIGGYAQVAILAIACVIVIFYGVYGYLVPAITRMGFSVYQVSAVIATIILVSVIDIFMYRKSKIVGPIRWGEIPARSQYALLMIAVTFIWLMGLMGFARSAMRQHWHIYGVLKDTSVDAYTPAIGYAANVVSVITIVFVGLLLFIFWLGTLGEKKGEQAAGFELVGDCGKGIGCCTFFKEFPKTASGLVLPANAAAQITCQNEPQSGTCSSKSSEEQVTNAKGSFGVLAKAIGFALALIGFFTLYANSIPQLVKKVPEEIIISEEGLTPGGLVAMGKAIFSGKGNCYVCHKDDGGRGPNLQSVGAIAESRKPDMTSKEYLMESLVQPEAYVVEEFSPIMPVANKSPISLIQIELLSLVAYLQSMGGIVSVTQEDIQSAMSVAIVLKGEEKGVSSDVFTVEGDIESGFIVFSEQGCNVCHKIEGEEEKISPNLSAIGGTSDIRYIKESILYPEAKIIKGYKFKMPKDYLDKLTVREFNDLVAFLASLKG
ncbi:MAG: cytochrome ubiquinol oxidase subunit I [Candidatus Anammoxibacter sp.]